MKTANLIPVLCFCSCATFAQLQPQGAVEFSGDILESSDLSAVHQLDDYLAIASDEGTVMQLLKREDETHYTVVESIELLPEASGEIDMEALAADGNTLYVLGSHSWGRAKTRSKYSRVKNREKLLEVALETSRDKLLRFDIDLATGKRTSAVESVSLRSLISNHPVLGLFANIPGKENGVDFEGMAVANDHLYLALRGPVLRGNYVPVIVLKFEDVAECASDFGAQPDKCRLHYVRLNGFGIRSLHRVRDGFLILAGPMNDSRVPYALYFWDGADCVTGKGDPACRLEKLAEIPRVAGSGPEGLAVLEEKDSYARILIVYDGVAGGAPAIFQLSLPRGGLF